MIILKMKKYFIIFSVPKFYKCRLILLALKCKVETQIDGLVNSNILVPVDYSKWATPIISILKSDGTVRICGNFNITINMLNMQHI